MAVSLRREPTFRAGTPRPLIEEGFTAIRSYDITPDGRRFVVIARWEEPGLTEGRSPNAPTIARHTWSTLRTTASPTAGLRVVTNWFAELEARGAEGGQ